MPMKIEHAALWANDIELLRDFYEKYFQTRSNKKYTNLEKGFSSYFLSFDSGARLEIMHLESGLGQNRSTALPIAGLSHIAISVGSEEKVRSLTAQLREDGYAVLSDPRKTGDGYFESIVLDPENNQIEITV